MLLFTLGVSFLTGIVFGILPALSSRADLVTAMKQGSKGAGDSPGRRRVQSGLIVAAGRGVGGAADRRRAAADEPLPAPAASIRATAPIA